MPHFLGQDATKTLFGVSKGVFARGGGGELSIIGVLRAPVVVNFASSPCEIFEFPDPTTLAFFGEGGGGKARETPKKKTRVFLFAEPLISLEKEGKHPNRAWKSENEKSKEIGKKARQTGGSGQCVLLAAEILAIPGPRFWEWCG